MECKNEHFRHILLYYFRKGKNAVQAAKKLRDVYGNEALKERQCRNWFEKFRSGDFSLKDDQRKISLNSVFGRKGSDFLRAWNFQVVREMAKGHRTKCKIHYRLNFIPSKKQIGNYLVANPIVSIFVTIDFNIVTCI
ncbi:hypothetical protein ACFW04_000204 [Cataglyphis niger]